MTCSLLLMYLFSISCPNRTIPWRSLDPRRPCQSQDQEFVFHCITIWQLPRIVLPYMTHSFIHFHPEIQFNLFHGILEWVYTWETHFPGSVSICGCRVPPILVLGPSKILFFVCPMLGPPGIDKNNTPGGDEPCQIKSNQINPNQRPMLMRWGEDGYGPSWKGIQPRVWNQENHESWHE